jgi:hypothetical protein
VRLKLRRPADRTPAPAGNLDCLRYAVEHGCPLSNEAILSAVADLPCLKYMHEEKGIALNTAVCAKAACFGGTGHLMYARERGAPWDARTCESAALCGQLANLRCAREHGCSWDAHTCEYAAMSGQLRTLCYAHEHGCLWDARRLTLPSGRANTTAWPTRYSRVPIGSHHLPRLLPHV